MPTIDEELRKACDAIDASKGADGRISEVNAITLLREYDGLTLRQAHTIVRYALSNGFYARGGR